MDKRIIEVLEEFAKFVNFDPKQTSFNLSFSNSLSSYELHERMKLIIELQNYDSTGSIQLMYAQHMCELFFKEQKITMMDYVSKKDELAEFDRIWNLFHQPFITEIKDEFLNNINSLTYHLMQGKVIGEFENLSVDDVLNVMSNTLGDIKKLKKDSYSVGVSKSDQLPIHTSIILFPSLKIALQQLTFAPSGIYVAYIGDSTLAGWFAIFIKDGDNLCSFNERYDFKYPNQLRNMRNGRSVSNSKAEGIFPYAYIFEYGSHDYKGYATEVHIKEDMLSFFNLGFNVYLPMLITMILLKGYYLNTDMEKHKVYSLPLMLDYAKQTSENQLIKIDNNHALTKVYADNPMRTFDFELVKQGHHAFEFGDSKKHYNAKMFTSGVNEKYVVRYCKDFSTHDLMSFTNTAIQLLDEGDFVGDRDRADVLLYWVQRDGLAKYIKTQLKQDFEDANKLYGLKKWFEGKVKKHTEQIIKTVLSFDRTNTYIEHLAHGYRKNSHNAHNISVSVTVGTDVKYCASASINTSKDLSEYRRGYPTCPITGKDVNFLFRCEVNSIDAIKQLFGENYDDNTTPAILKTWEQFTNEYEGNSILDLIDPVDLLEHPINTDGRSSRYSPFNFSIAFSKSGYIQYCKNHNITIDKFWMKNR